MHIYIDDNSNPLKEFHLPADFYPELSRTNPFLTDEGSQSIPLTLPTSEHNLKIMGFDYRSTQTKRPEKKIPVIFNDETSWLKGTLFLEKSNRKEGISCTFYTNEGQFYEKIKGYKLADLNWPEKKGIGNELEDRCKWWLNHFETLMNSESTNEDYFIFGLHTSSLFFIEKNSKIDFFLLLNETNGISPLKFLANDVRTYYSEAEEDAIPLTVPIGYGVTPFLKLSYVLRHVMEYFGYILDSNIFDTDISLSRLVLLNNTADSIVNGTLSYKQLLPDKISVEDFINFTRSKFGIEFIQRGNHIQIMSWQDVLKYSPDMDLSSYITDTSTFILEEKKALSMKYELTYERDTMYLGYFNQTEYELTHNAPSGYTEVELKTEDKTPSYSNVNTGYKKIHFPYSIRTRFLHIDGVKNLNSEMQISGSSKDVENESEEIGIVCGFSTPGIQKDDSSSVPYEYYSGTIFSYNSITKKWGTYSLVANESKLDAENPDSPLALKDNLYNKCYILRDNMLKKANQIVEYQGEIPSHIISSLKIDYPKIINGQKILIERIDYIMGRPDLCKITARTLHEYPD